MKIPETAFMHRRTMIQLAASALAATGLAPASSVAQSITSDAPGNTPWHEPRPNPGASVEQWDVCEITLSGPSGGNPFTDVRFGAIFSLGHRQVSVDGFYDGDGVYRVRFMPDMTGDWSWQTFSSHAALNKHHGSFTCTPPSADNHGLVTTAHQFHFAYADGTPYFPFGTTCYAYAFMGAPWEEDTLTTLRSTGFNKVRLCLLPKPIGYDLFALPFEKNPDGSFDFLRLNPEYFRHVEQRIAALLPLGIQADVILFHPYDGWGFEKMPAEANDLYLRYAVARLAAYRHVWWSLANEYDLIKTKNMGDWDHYFHVVQQADPHGHLRSIHQSKVKYDNSKPWVTHASLQEYDFDMAAEYRAAWGKPIVWDEIQYEGNIARRWGNLSAEEMTHRFWSAVVHGTYASHGETYITPPGVPVWSNGGKLMGTSPARIAWLRSLVERITHTGLTEYDGSYYLSAGLANELYLYYFDFHRPAEYDFPLPPGIDFKATLLDPWEMTSQTLPGTVRRGEKGSSHINDGTRLTASTSRLTLPGKPYMAILFEKA